MSIFGKRAKTQPLEVAPPAEPPPIGTLVSVRIQSHSRFSSGAQAIASKDCEVTAVQGDTFTVQPLTREYWHEEQQLEVAWADGDDVHVIMVSVHKETTSGYELRCSSFRHALPQLRSSERVALSRRAQCALIKSRVYGENSGRVIDVQTVDLSTGGLCFATSAPLSPGDTIEIAIADTAFGPWQAQVIRASGATSAWQQHISAKWLSPLAKLPADD